MKPFEIMGADALGVLRRFVKKIKLVDGCWQWTGAINSKGYPMLWVNGQAVGAHRIAHMLFIGQFKNDQVHHECLNQRCVNPMHLHDLTAEQNRTLQALGTGDPRALPADLGIPF